MSKQLLILGGGTASTMIANHLRRRLPVSEWRMTVVDRSNKHLYQPGFFFFPSASPRRATSSARRGISCRLEASRAVSPKTQLLRVEEAL
jgi:sulfide:quinone oxidoreductase